MNNLYHLFMRHIAFISILILLIVAGVISMRSIGISFDEDAQRSANGLANYYYIRYDNLELLTNSNEKYHGPAFEIFLVAIEKVLHLNTAESIKTLRHSIVFIIYLLAVLTCYLISLRIFKTRIWALLSVLLFVLSPRIYADAFYNTKDIPFLAFTLFSFFWLIKYFEKPTLIKALTAGFFTAFAIDIRIIGVILPVVFVLFQIGTGITEAKQKLPSIKVVFLFLILMATTLFFTYLMWPILWQNPIHHFTEALNEASKFQWANNVFYCGKPVIVSDLPWHYLPLWIIITNPATTVLSAITGVVLIAKDALLNLKSNAKTDNHLLFLVIYLLLIFLIVFIKKPIIYDAWRHFFFIYPIIVFIAVAALKQLFERLSLNKSMMQKFITGVLTMLLMLELAVTASDIIYLHPYPNVFYNRLYFKNYEDFASAFETDYWDLSFEKLFEMAGREALSPITAIYFDNVGYLGSYYALSNYEKQRIVRCPDFNHAELLLTNYRNVKHLNASETEVVDSVMAGAGCIARVVRNKNFKYRKPQHLFTVIENFEDSVFTGGIFQKFNNDSVIGNVNVLNYDFQYSATFRTDTVLLKNKSFYYAKIKFSKYNFDPYSLSYLVVALDSPEGNKYYESNLIDCIHTEKSHVWYQEEFTVYIPRITDSNQTLSIFINNVGKTKVVLDNFRIDFYSLN